MKYYTTLIGKEKYAFNGNRFKKNERVEVNEGVYKAVKDSPLFYSEVFESSLVDNFESTIKLDETMNIVLAYSPNWSTHVRKQVYSIFKNNPPPVRVYLLSDALGKIDIDDICDTFGKGYSYQCINVEPMYKRLLGDNVNVSSRFTKYTLYRLLIPKLFKSTDRLLYIDSDTLVVDNIRKFYHMDLEGNWLAGAMDIGVAMPAVRKGIDFTPDEVYINAGVTLMDLKALRHLGDTWIKMCNETPYLCHDQDILNITCRGKVKLVSNVYNSSVSTGIAPEGIKIAHYAGAKPWTKKAPQTLQRLWDMINYPCRKIPKRIHYCWFGKNEKPEVIQKCIESWKKHMPTYEIIEWNEDTFDLEVTPEYVRQAVREKKWAFVTDYIRLWALDKFGGIYMDSDVFVVRPLDKFLLDRAFTGHETEELTITAVMGAEPEHPWIRHLLSYYTKAKFSAQPNTPVITQMSKPFIIHSADGFKILKEDVVIYPVSYFCSYDHKNLVPIPTHDSYAFHMFAGTWLGRKKVNSGGLF